MGTSYDPPPPNLELVPDTGRHGYAIGDHEGRLRAVEKCQIKTSRDVAIGKWLIGIVLAAVLGSGVGAIYSAGQLTTQVENLVEGVSETTRLREAHATEVDELRNTTRSEITEIRVGVSGLEATVNANESNAKTRDNAIQNELSGIRAQLRRVRD